MILKKKYGKLFWISINFNHTRLSQEGIKNVKLYHVAKFCTNFLLWSSYHCFFIHRMNYRVWKYMSPKLFYGNACATNAIICMINSYNLQSDLCHIFSENSVLTVQDANQHTAQLEKEKNKHFDLTYWKGIKTIIFPPSSLIYLFIHSLIYLLHFPHLQPDGLTSTDLAGGKALWCIK